MCLGESAWPRGGQEQQGKARGKLQEGAGWNMGGVGFAYEGLVLGHSLPQQHLPLAGASGDARDLPPTGK